MAQTRTIPRTVIELGTIDDVRNAGNLLEQHWRELCTDPELMELDPDWRGYYDLEERGRTFTLVVRRDGATVGYSLNFLFPHLHYKQTLMAQNDVLFVDPALRRTTGIGPRLIRATEAQARELGAHLICWHAKQNTALDSYLPKQGYRVQDVFYSRRL